MVPLSKPVESPGAIAVDDAGHVYISDLGADLQVKEFAADGRLVKSFGKQGGRARQGVFDPSGMRYMAGLAVDAGSNVWVAEASHNPRRVSVWNADGSLKRDFIGNTGYAGQGSFIHDSDPARGVAELNEIRLDPATRKWAIENVMYNPDPAKGDFVQPGSTAFGSGNVFLSKASGKEHEYFVALGETRNTPVFVMIKAGRDWQAVSGIFTVARLQGLLGGMYGAQVVKDSFGEYAANDPCDLLIWNDFNNDGYTVHDPTPWKNSGNEFRLLFKTGDCVDIQLSPSGNKTDKAVAGDLRVIMANFQGQPVAVLMKPIAPVRRPARSTTSLRP